MSLFNTAEFQTFIVEEGTNFIMLERIDYPEAKEIKGIFYVLEG